MQYYAMTTQLAAYLPYPKFLLTVPVNETAKLIYILILDRIRLSQSNHWADSDGKVYCRYPISALAADSRKSKSTIVTALSDLEKQGLLYRCREGRGRASKLYILIPESCHTVCQKSVPDYTRKPAANKSKEYNYDYIGDGL